MVIEPPRTPQLSVKLDLPNMEVFMKNRRKWWLPKDWHSRKNEKGRSELVEQAEQVTALQQMASSQQSLQHTPLRSPPLGLGLLLPLIGADRKTI